MKRKKINYSDLTKRELEYLKESYVENKILSMNEKELTKYVHDSISHQIKDTIGDEEEIEAWREMEVFFDDQFETIIENIRVKFKAFDEGRDIEVLKHDAKSHKVNTEDADKGKEDMW